MSIYLAKPLSSRWEWGTRLSKIDPDLARVATFSDRENAAISRDLYRLAQVLVDQFVGSYSKVAEVIVLDLGHAEVDERFFFTISVTLVGLRLMTRVVLLIPLLFRTGSTISTLATAIRPMSYSLMNPSRSQLIARDRYLGSPLGNWQPA